jgi:hypothetical protein
VLASLSAIRLACSPTRSAVGEQELDGLSQDNIVEGSRNKSQVNTAQADEQCVLDVFVAEGALTTVQARCCR